jgi:methyl-accepting chemotaxis protein
MIGAFKDSYKLSLLATTIFLASILVSGYFLYTLPHALKVSGDFTADLTKVYVTIAISFLLGGVALYLALRSQREIVVYRDRTLESDKGDAANAGNETKTTITLDGVRASMQHTPDEKETLKVYLQAVCKQLDAGQGALYLVTDKEGIKRIELKSGYALNIGENATIGFDLGEGLVGQCAISGRTLYIDDIPDGYIKIISGLGSASPKYLLIVPVVRNEQVIGVVEIASFTAISKDQQRFVEESIHLLNEKISKPTA